MTTTYIGIDNGISGAIAILSPDNNVTLQLMPVYKTGTLSFIDELAVYDILNSFKIKEENVHIIFEQGQKNPIFGTKGNFSNGYSFGVIHTILKIVKVPFTLVNPQTWQKVMFKDIRGMKNKSNKNGKTTKDASIEVCKRLYPEQSLIPIKRSKKPHDGLADALLMATYGKRENL